MKVLYLLVLCAALAHGQDSPQPKITEGKTFTKSSVFEMSLAGAAIAGDAWSTHRFIGLSYAEHNPIARPFVRTTAGTVVYFGASYGAVIGGNYLLRNHPRWRHALNWSVITTETTYTILNLPVSNCASIWIKQGIVVPPCHHI